jgi:hypothetical protein
MNCRGEAVPNIFDGVHAVKRSRTDGRQSRTAEKHASCKVYHHGYYRDVAKNLDQRHPSISSSSHHLHALIIFFAGHQGTKTPSSHGANLLTPGLIIGGFVVH